MADNSIVLGSAAKSAVYTIMIQVMGPEVRGYIYPRIDICGYPQIFTDTHRIRI